MSNITDSQDQLNWPARDVGQNSMIVGRHQRSSRESVGDNSTQARPSRRPGSECCVSRRNAGEEATQRMREAAEFRSSAVHARREGNVVPSFNSSAHLVGVLRAETICRREDGKSATVARSSEARAPA